MTPSAAGEPGADDLSRRWRDAFLECAEHHEAREGLRAAAEAGDLTRWTKLLTGVVVGSCEDLGWRAAAKGHKLDFLPEPRHEYLGLDVTAFPPAVEGGSRWVFPSAVFELENSTRDDRVAYSIWKVACVRAPFAVVFAYRTDWNAAESLAQALGKGIPAPVATSEQTLVLALGSRERGGSFPWRFFRFLRYTPAARAFTKL